MASDMKKEGRKPNWSLIALIAFCVCAVVAAAVLVIIQFLPREQTEPAGPGTAVEDSPEEPEEAPEPEVEESFEVNASAGALAALDKYDPEVDVRYNVLLTGVDMGGSLTDVIMLYQIDPENQRVNLLSIPRDSKVSYNGRVEKINAIHSYGRQQRDPQGGDRADEFTISFVRELTGIPIHHFACINTAAFRDIIDALDGFDFEVPRSMNYDDGYQNLHIHLEKGMQHLDGAKAEQLVRFRRYPGGDIDRVATQQAALKALAEQKLTPQYIAKAPEILDIIKDNVSTDLTPLSIAKLAADIQLAMENEAGGINAFTAPGSFGESGGISYWLLDRAGLGALVKDTFGYE